MDESRDLFEDELQQLKQIERLLFEGEGNCRDDRSLPGFCTYLAGSAPQAAPGFQDRLQLALSKRWQELHGRTPSRSPVVEYLPVLGCIFRFFGMRRSPGAIRPPTISSRRRFGYITATAAALILMLILFVQPLRIQIYQAIRGVVAKSTPAGVQMVLATHAAVVPAIPPSASPLVKLPANLHPLIPGWEIAGSPQLSRNGYTLGVLFVWFSNGTQVFYALTGISSEQLAEKETIQMRDDRGNVRELLEMIPILKTEEVEVGVMRFNDRDVRSRELYLRMLAKPEQDSPIETLMLKVLEGDPEYVEIGCGGCAFGIESPQTLGNNRILMGCDLFHPEAFQDPLYALTPTVRDTQIPIEPSMLATSTPVMPPTFHGVPFFIEIKNQPANSAHCYTMFLNDDGTIISNLMDNTTPLPIYTPILFPTHVPGDPYPGPILFPTHVLGEPYPEPQLSKPTSPVQYP